MSNFSAAAELDVGVNSRSLRSARATIEDELSDVEVNASASNQLASGGSRMAGKERAMSRSLLSDQNGHLATLRDTLDINLDLNEERNDILREILDAQELTAREQGGSGRGIMGMGLMGLGLLGGGITLAASAIFSIGKKLVPSVDDLMNIGRKIVPDVDDLLEIGALMTVPVSGLIEIGEQLVVDAKNLIEVGEPVADPTPEPVPEPVIDPDVMGTPDPSSSPTVGPTSQNLVDAMGYDAPEGTGTETDIGLDEPVPIPILDPTRENRGQTVGSVTTDFEPRSNPQEVMTKFMSGLGAASIAGLGATGGAGLGARIIGGGLLGAGATGAAAAEPDSTRGTPNRNETQVQADIQQRFEVALDMSSVREVEEFVRNPERYINDKIDLGGLD